MRQHFSSFLYASLLSLFAFSSQAEIFVPISVGDITVIIPIDEAPMAVDDSFSFAEKHYQSTPPNAADLVHTLDILANDVDEALGDVTVELLSSTSLSGHSISLDGQKQVTYSLPAGWVGQDSFTYTLTDIESQQSAVATVTINVLEGNDPPVIIREWLSIEETALCHAQRPAGGGEAGISQLIADCSFEFDVTANDFDEETSTGQLVLSGVKSIDNATYYHQPNNVTYALSGGLMSAVVNNKLVVVSGAAFYDTNTAAPFFLYSIEDEQGLTDEAPIVFNPVVNNQIPVVTAVTPNINQYYQLGESVTLQATATDVDGTISQVRFSLDGENWSAGTLNGGVYSWAAPSLAPNQYVAQYQALDDDGAFSNTGTVPFVVEGTPATLGLTVQGLVATPVQVEEGSDVTVSWSAPAIVVSNMAYFIAQDTSASTGSFSMVNGTSYISTLNSVGSYTFRVKVCRTSGQHCGPEKSVLAAVPEPLNINPIAVDDVASVDEGSGDAVLDVLVNDTDADGDSLTIISSTSPSLGAVSCTASACTFDASGVNITADATTSFDYNISDGNGGTASATVYITILNSEPLPTLPLTDLPSQFAYTSAQVEESDVVDELVAHTTGSYSVSHGRLEYRVNLDIPTFPTGLRPNFSIVANGKPSKVIRSQENAHPITICSASSPIRSAEEFDSDTSEIPDPSMTFKRICYNNIVLENLDTSLNDSENGYWTENSVYYSPTNPDFKIQAGGTISFSHYPTLSRAHKYFEVMLPNGTKEYYGDYGTGYIALQNRHAHEFGKWPLARIEDAYGNYIDYYAGSNIAPSANRLVYSNGYEIRREEVITNELTTVDIYAPGDVPIRQYKIDYITRNAPTRVTLLSQVTECGFTENAIDTSMPVCAEPLSFEWNSPIYSNTLRVLEHVTHDNGRITYFTYDDNVSGSVLKKVTMFDDGVLPTDPELQSADISYTYNTAMNNNGNFDGFEQVTAYNHNANTYRITNYVYDVVPNVPFTSQVQTGRFDGRGPYALSDTTYEYAALSGSSAYYLDNSFTKRYSLTDIGNAMGPTSNLVGTSSTDNTVDQYGNLTGQTTKIGTDFVGSPGAETVTNELSRQVMSVTDMENDETNWLIGFVKDVTTTTTSYHPVTNTKTIRQSFTKEAGTTDVKTTTTYKDDNIAVLHTTTINRDGSGNITSLAEGGVNASGIAETRTSSFSGFNAYGSPSTVTNAEQHASTLLYDGRFQTVKSSTDSNSLTSTVQYNELGQVTKRTNHLNVEVDTIRFYCVNTSCPTGAYYGITNDVTHTNETGIGAPTTISYYSAEHLMVAQDTYTLGGTVMRQSRTYYDDDRLQSISVPYALPGSATVWATTNYYDFYGRLSSVVNGDGGSTIFSYDVDTLPGWGSVDKVVTTTTVLKPDGTSDTQLKASYSNALGQLVKVVDGLDITVEYEYDAHGNLTKTKVNDDDATNVVIGYDNQGRRTSMQDPSTGNIAFAYSDFSELKEQTWAPGTDDQKSMAFAYDKLGRLTGRSDKVRDTAESRDGEGQFPDKITATHAWVWDTQLNGLLDKVRTGISTGSSEQHKEEYTYNTSGLLTDVDVSVAGTAWTANFSYTYDSFGRVATESYPDNDVFKRVYHDSGFPMEALEQGSTNKRIWRAGKRVKNGSDYISEMLYGGSVVSTQQFDAYGRLSTITSGRYAGSNASIGSDIQSHLYQFDTQGNLRKRESAILGESRLRETFDYDKNNRLKQNQIYQQGSGNSYNLLKSVDYNYNALGNLTYRSDKGSLSNSNGTAQNVFYEKTGNASVHAITKAYGVGSNSEAEVTYAYDAYGNVTSRGGKSIEYNVFNKPTNIDGELFAYTADHVRYKKTAKDGAVTYYAAGGKYEQIVDGSTTTKNSYVDGMYLLQDVDGVKARFFMLKDHIGSVDTITNEQGVVTQRTSFNAWGERRNSLWTDAAVDINGVPTTRGFTGHETLDDNDLVHMNGRVYDPTVGRFLSADIFIQAPTNTQSYNRYSYVFNNPLSFVDPSGYTASGPCQNKDDPDCPKGQQEPSEEEKRRELLERQVRARLNDIRFNGVNGSADLAFLGSFQHAQIRQGFENWKRASVLITDLKTTSLAITEKQRAYAINGNRKAFWLSRLAAGDPLASTALKILSGELTGDSLLEFVTNMRLNNYLLTSGSSLSNNDVGVALMNAHISATDFDVNNNIGTPGLLSADQIDAYHYSTFNSLGIPDVVYGGSFYENNLQENNGGWGIFPSHWRNDGILSYCSGCDNIGTRIN